MLAKHSLNLNTRNGDKPARYRQGSPARPGSRLRSVNVVDGFDAVDTIGIVGIAGIVTT